MFKNVSFRNVGLGALGCLLVMLGTFAFGETAYMYINMPAGTIHGAFVDYNDANSVDIAAGYGECNGHYWELTSTTRHDMISLDVNDFSYIYIDDSASSYPAPTIIDSTTEPSWSDSKFGYYNGDDRCIGVVWSQYDSTIKHFVGIPDLKIINCDATPIRTVLTNGNPTGAGEFLETTAYIPKNAIAVRIHAWNKDTGGDCLVKVYAYGSGGSHLQASGYNGTATVVGWIELGRNSSRDLGWYGPDDDDNGYTIEVESYQIER
jgi:hypothetical protein